MGIFSNVLAPAMDSRKLKDGMLKRYKSGFLSGKWKDSYTVLYSDSTLCWYNERGDSRPAGSVLLKDVVPYICIGQMTDRMPVRRPSLPQGASVHHLVAVGCDPRADKVHWFLFGSDSDLEAWFTEITKTLPKVNPPPNAGATGPPPPPGFNAPSQNSGSGEYNPPARYPGAPPPYNPAVNSPTPSYPPSGGYPQPAGGYPNPPRPQTAYGYNSGGYGGQSAPGGYAPPGQTTVIIDRDRGYGGGSSFGGGGSSGLGLGTGLLGGALLGYGLGSFFAPHHYGGGGWGGGYGMGGGYGGGFGGGYYSDNDTTINNYYNTTNTDTTTNNYNPDSGTVSQPTDTSMNDVGYDSNDYQNAMNDYSGGGGFDSGALDTSGFDTGGFDSGGFDMGGSDFGGADFGDF